MRSTSTASTDSDVLYSDKLHRYADGTFVHQRIRLVVGDTAQRQDVVKRNYPDGHVTEMFCATRTYPLSSRENLKLVQSTFQPKPVDDAEATLQASIENALGNQPWD